MPRKPRQKSNTGVYHVMLRGINKQNIFFDADDFIQMQRAIRDSQKKVYPDGRISYQECQIYAYCIMNNHVHILLREGNLNLSAVMQKIEDRYAYVYNKKYDRVGHLFQGRFKSEPVGNKEYFHVLLRYIHRNPVVGMECELPEEYTYSSWREYLQMVCDSVTVILPAAFNVVDAYFERRELIEWVNMNVKDNCMDMDSERFVVSDSHAWAIIKDISGEENPETFKCFSQDFQLQCIKEAVKTGISLKQAARLSSVSYYRIRKFLGCEDDSLDIHGDFIAMEHDSATVVRTPSMEKCRKYIDSLENERDRTKAHLIRILSLFRDRNDIDCTYMCEALNISDSLGRRLLRLLVTLGIIAKDGRTRGSRYIINSQFCTE